MRRGSSSGLATTSHACVFPAHGQHILKCHTFPCLLEQKTPPQETGFFLSALFETGLFLSSAFSLFFHLPLLLQPLHPHAPMLLLWSIEVWTDLFFRYSVEFGNSQEIQFPKNRFFPSLESLGALSLWDPGSKMCSGPRSAGVQEAELPFRFAGGGSCHQSAQARLGVGSIQGSLGAELGQSCKVSISGDQMMVLGTVRATGALLTLHASARHTGNAGGCCNAQHWAGRTQLHGRTPDFTDAKYRHF